MFGSDTKFLLQLQVCLFALKWEFYSFWLLQESVEDFECASDILEHKACMEWVSLDILEKLRVISLDHIALFEGYWFLLISFLRVIDSWRSASLIPVDALIVRFRAR